MKINKIICGVLGAVTLCSCGDKMDYNEYNIYEKDYITRNFGYVGGLMTKIYNDLDGDWGNYGGAMLASATDESQVSHSGNQIEDFYNGAWSPSNAKSSMWTTCYDGIEYSNQVLENFKDLTFDELVLNSDYAKQMFRYNNYQYEARWARAYFYFLLVRQYGGVPLKTTTMSASESNALTRATADEVFKFIDDECKEIQDLIVKDYTDLGDYTLGVPETGRANMFSVLALRARAAMYHASPLFNKDNDKELWHDAAKACQALVDSCQKYGRTLADGSAGYALLWSEKSYSETASYQEILFGRRYDAARTFETYNFPTGYQSAGGYNCPTQNLVDAYDFKDNDDELNVQLAGLTVAEARAAYKNVGLSDNEIEVKLTDFSKRDPRLALTVAQNGDDWPTDKDKGYSALETYVGGLHGRPTSAYATPTGYYLKKYCNASTILRSAAANSFAHIWLTFRLGEAYLNYAECLFRYFEAQGYTDAAYKTDEEFTMNAASLASKTRQRVNMPSFKSGLNNDEFWEKYKQERFVELAFEGHRFFDVRRWKEAPDYFKNIVWMQIEKNPDGSYAYTRVNQTRDWADKMYLFPIPQSDIAKSGGLIEQNPEW